MNSGLPASFWAGVPMQYGQRSGFGGPAEFDAAVQAVVKNVPVATADRLLTSLAQGEKARDDFDRMCANETPAEREKREAAWEDIKELSKTLESDEEIPITIIDGPSVVKKTMTECTACSAAKGAGWHVHHAPGPDQCPEELEFYK